jgi:hypothetical protein
VEATRHAQRLHATALAAQRAEEASASAARRAATPASPAAAARVVSAAAEADQREEARVVREQMMVEEARLAAEARKEAEVMEAVRQEEERRAEQVRREEAARLAAAAKLAAAATQAAEAAASQAAQAVAWQGQWARVLASAVVLQRGDGVRIELSGGQVVGLSDALRRSSQRAVAFMHDGVRVRLSADVVQALRGRLDGRMAERPNEHGGLDALVLPLPAGPPRAVTASVIAPSAQGGGSGSGGDSAAEEHDPRLSQTAPARGDALLRPLSQQWLRATGMSGLAARSSARVAPEPPAMGTAAPCMSRDELTTRRSTPRDEAVRDPNE